MPQAPFSFTATATTTDGLKFNNHSSLLTLISAIAKKLVAPYTRYLMTFGPRSLGPNYYPRVRQFENMNPRERLYYIQHYERYTANLLAHGAVIPESVLPARDRLRRAGMLETLGPQCPFSIEVLFLATNSRNVSGLTNAGHLISRDAGVEIEDGTLWLITCAPLEEIPAHRPISNKVAEYSRDEMAESVEYFTYLRRMRTVAGIR